MNRTADNLATGFYTLGEATRLLGEKSPQRLRGWIGANAHRYKPLIQRQYERIGRINEVGFLDLMEMRFLTHFREKGISLQSLRKAAQTARKELKQDHPFATSNVRFMSDRKEIFLQTAKETGDLYLLNLMTRQIEAYEVLEQVLANDLTFDQSTGVAKTWMPLRDECPHIIIDPRIAYGHPVVSPHNVPTSALYSFWKAENEDIDAVADWFEVNRDAVNEAIHFEVRLAA